MQPGIHRRIYPVSAAKQFFHPNAKYALRFFKRCVYIIAAVRFLLLGQNKRLCGGLLLLLLRYIAIVIHKPYHGVSPFQRSLVINMRRVGRGRLEYARQIRRLRNAQLVRPHAEIVQRSRFYSVAARAEVHIIEIHFKYVVFFIQPLHLHCKHGFLKLSGYCFFACKVAQLYKLLSNGACALGKAHLLYVRPQRAHNADEINAAVLIKARILGRNERLLHMVRQLLYALIYPVLLCVQAHCLRIAAIVYNKRLRRRKYLIRVKILP